MIDIEYLYRLSDWSEEQRQLTPPEPVLRAWSIRMEMICFGESDNDNDIYNDFVITLNHFRIKL